MHKINKIEKIESFSSFLMLANPVVSVRVFALTNDWPIISLVVLLWNNSCVYSTECDKQVGKREHPHDSE